MLPKNSPFAHSDQFQNLVRISAEVLIWRLVINLVLVQPKVILPVKGCHQTINQGLGFEFVLTP